jgi:hypothetical protein
MRIATWFLSVTVGVSLLIGTSGASNALGQISTDPYSLSFVKSAFETFGNQQGVWGAQIHQFNNNSPALPQLGDGVSIAALKLYGLDELLVPEKTRTYLALVVFSFSDRNRVLEKSDREPRITSLVLDYLQEKKLSEPHTEKAIEYLKLCTKDFSCSFEKESRFLAND